MRSGRKHCAVVFALVWATFWGVAMPRAATVDYFADNGFDAAVNPLQHPCAEYFNGKTYIAYQGPHEDAYVCVYDHATRQWQGPVRAGASTLEEKAARGHSPAREGRGGPDNHGRPALVVDGRGYVHLIFGGHGGWHELGENLYGTPGSGRQTHVVTTTPEDITSWEVRDNVDPFGTYSQFVKIEDGNIYLFYRHGSHCSDWVYQKSTDNCVTFSPPVSILKHKVQAADPNTHDSWYAWFTKGKGDTVIVMYVYHPCLEVNHTKQRVNAYYMKMDCVDETWENVSGTSLRLPVTKESADALTLVYDSGTVKVNHGVCRMDDTGAPHLFFRQSGASVAYTRWLGNAWQKPTTVSPASGSQDGDMLVVSPTEVRLLLDGGRPGRSGGEVCWWKTIDGGLSWKKESTIVSSDTMHYKVSAFVRNPSADGQIVVEEHDPASTDLYRRLFFWGGSGFVGRPEEGARSPRPSPPEGEDAAQTGVRQERPAVPVREEVFNRK